MRRVRGHGRGRWVCAPRDFLDLGSREAVDGAPPRLVRGGYAGKAELEHAFDVGLSQGHGVNSLSLL